MIELTMQGANIGVQQDGPNKVLVAVDPHSGITVRIGFTPDTAQAFAAALSAGGLQIASSLPEAVKQ